MKISGAELLNSPTVFVSEERDQNLHPFPGKRVLGTAESWRGWGEVVWKVTMKGRRGLGFITGANSQEGMNLLPLNVSLEIELAFSLPVGMLRSREGDTSLVAVRKGSFHCLS